MTLQTIKIGKREFVLLARRDFERLAARAQQQTEDEYWTRTALDAEAKSRARAEKPIPFEEVERQLEDRKKRAIRRRGRR